MRLVVAALLFAGCAHSRDLGRGALACHQKAERLSQLGESTAAWEARQCAASRDVASQLTREKHSSWYWYDFTLK